MSRPRIHNGQAGWTHLLQSVGDIVTMNKMLLHRLARGPTIRIQRENVGQTAGHASQAAMAVDGYTVDSEAGLAVTVWTYGATLVEVLVPDRTGRRTNVVLRLPDLGAYEDRSRNPYLGAVLGRYCRCVSDGRLVLNGIRYNLDRNDGRHHFHGGSIGFDRLVWDADAGLDGGAGEIRLRLLNADGEQGYPGELSVEVTYRVESPNRLVLDYRATTTADTVVGLTNHAFWNLAGGGRIDDHRLAVNAVRYLRFDADLIPVDGPPASVVGTPLDFRQSRSIGTDRLDNFLVLDDSAWAAELVDPSSGRVMAVTTDQPGLGVYSGDGLPEPRTGLSLQTSAWPDAPNRADYPPVRLSPGEVYVHRTVHEFTVH
jgi:aldose 1-epimerase